MDTKIILITGATNGIGKATASALAQQGHTLILHGRNKQKAEAVRDELIAESGNRQIDVLIANLTLLADVKRMADAFYKKYDRLDVLINNAGAFFGKDRATTPEGLEQTMALNLFSPLLLTELLIKALAKSPAGRVVNVSSAMHKNGGKPDLGDIQLQNSYGPARAYGLSKLYLIWAGRHLTAELKQQGLSQITVNSLHPGSVGTNFGQDGDKGFLINLVFKLAKLAGPLGTTPEQGAATSVYLATSDEVVGVRDKYFVKQKEAKTDERYYSPANEQKVWDYSMTIIKPYL